MDPNDAVWPFIERQEDLEGNYNEVMRLRSQMRFSRS